MQEQHVTVVGGRSFGSAPLFLVLATQNSD